uniref:Uncharacterized protein n=1 Tax=Myotis lucifugus TaxID=59463 RepID=G1QF77_MYOLU
MGISQSKRKTHHQKRKYKLGCPAASTEVAPRRTHSPHAGDNKKYPALRLDADNFFRGSECCTGNTGIIHVVDHAPTRELVRTYTLEKNRLVLTDSTANRSGGVPLLGTDPGKPTPEEEEILNKKMFKENSEKDESRKNAQISSLLEEQVQQGKLPTCFSRTGQCGPVAGSLLEVFGGEEVDFRIKWIFRERGR